LPFIVVGTVFDDVEYCSQAMTLWEIPRNGPRPCRPGPGGG
jgi:hypothetical protein